MKLSHPPHRVCTCVHALQDEKGASLGAPAGWTPTFARPNAVTEAERRRREEARLRAEQRSELMAMAVETRTRLESVVLRWVGNR